MTMGSGKHSKKRQRFTSSENCERVDHRRWAEDMVHQARDTTFAQTKSSRVEWIRRSDGFPG
jgi:hypothetical protein